MLERNGAGGPGLRWSLEWKLMSQVEVSADGR